MGATIKDADILTMDSQKGFSPESIFNANLRLNRPKNFPNKK
jgi:hypothetical protein